MGIVLLYLEAVPNIHINSDCQICRVLLKAYLWP